MRPAIVVFGAGGHSKVVVEVIERQGRYRIAFLADADESKAGTTVLGYPVRAERDAFVASKKGITNAIVAIGNNGIRRRIANVVELSGMRLVSAVHPTAVVSTSASIGRGTVLMAGCIINADARIGDNVIINTGAVVEHDCQIDADVHVAPHATLCGGVVIGAGTLVGAASTLLPLVHVGTGVCVGAGATVLHDIPDGVTAAGSPCRKLERPA